MTCKCHTYAFSLSPEPCSRHHIFYAVTKEMRSLPWKEPHSGVDFVLPAAVSLKFCLSECQVASPSGLPAAVLCGLVLIVPLGMTRWHIYFPNYTHPSKSLAIMIPATKLSYVLILSYFLYHQQGLYRHPLDSCSNEQSINKLPL